MKPVTVPNLPTEDIRTVIIDGRAPLKVVNSIKDLGIDIIPTGPHPDVYQAVSYHPDIMLHHIMDNIVVYAPNTPVEVLTALSARGFKLIQGYSRLGNKYPMTIAYNIARVGGYALHNTKYTDPVVKELLSANNVELIHTNQGYAKCLTCVVDSNSIISSDADICKRAGAAGIDALLIEPDESIRLEQFDMGFIGGSTGLIGRNRLAVTGNLRFHKNYQKILDFLSLKRVDVVMLNDDRLIDLGTIIPIEQK